MKKDKKTEGRSNEAETDVSNLAFEAARMAATWDEPADVTDDTPVSPASAEVAASKTPAIPTMEAADSDSEIGSVADDLDEAALVEEMSGPPLLEGDDLDEDEENDGDLEELEDEMAEDFGFASKAAPDTETEIETETEGAGIDSGATVEAEAMTEAGEAEGLASKLEGDEAGRLEGAPSDEADDSTETLGAANTTGESEGSAAGPNEEAFISEEDILPTELSEVQAKSIIESVLFALVHPVSFASLKSLFYKTNIDGEKLKDILNHMQTDYAGGERGIVLEEVAGGYQFRTKLDNTPWLRKMVKARPFRLSGPALEVLSIIAYKQPVVKAEVDQIRGVESGHLVRALMDKHLVKFAGKSELPGKPMLYGTTRQFLELFGLRNIRELPTLSEIDKLIPEGIGEISEIDGETLSGLAEKIGLAPGKTYSESEAELLSITEQLSTISTSSEFFEAERQKERERRDQERAQDLRERQIVGEALNESDTKWLARFDKHVEALASAATGASANTNSGTNANAEAGTDAHVDGQAASADKSDELLPELRGTDALAESMDVAAMVAETFGTEPASAATESTAESSKAEFSKSGEDAISMRENHEIKPPELNE